MELYFQNDIEKKLLVKLPKNEEFDLTPATRLLEKRREMLEVENGLKKQKEEFAMKVESLGQRREELVKKEMQLKESLLKFDKFLQENDAKRLRAIKKAIEERKVKDQKEQEIVDLKEYSFAAVNHSRSHGALITKRERQVEVIDTNSSFHSYLEGMLESNLEYVEVKDIISRFDTLSATNSELVDRSREAQSSTEQKRQAFAISSEEKNNLILNCNNQIAKLQAKLEEKKAVSAKSQAGLDNVLKNASAKSLLLGQVKMATNNLFLIVKAHLNNRLHSTTGILPQLDKIGQFIVDMNDIVASDKE